MAKTLILIPTHYNAGLYTCSATLAKKYRDLGAKVSIHQPFVVQASPEYQVEKHQSILSDVCSNFTIGMNQADINQAINNNALDDLLEEVVKNHRSASENQDVVITIGLSPEMLVPYADELNEKLIRTFDAEVVLVSDAWVENVEQLNQRLVYMQQRFSFARKERMLGAIVNHCGIKGGICKEDVEKSSLFTENFSLLAAIAHYENKSSSEIVEDAAQSFNANALQAYLKRDYRPRLSPAAFRNEVVERAVQGNKRIVLPEGDEPRTVQAANICAGRSMARCVLLASAESVKKVAKELDIELHPSIEILDPADIREQYVERLVELRKHKGMDEAAAREQLQDNVVLGTMMLEKDEVDGLVSGAVHTTANTIRPPLQIIKTQPGANIVSSVFFMCLPDQVLVYGDCAVNPNPSSDELAQIAIQSADSAKAFGITPKVAMISYSTGSSGVGEDVELVTAATEKVRELRPDIPVDGPLQYDAASVESVARKKAPNSEVAGQANVFIFPDLNTGNTTYKAVQRTANVVAVGPMLQGMRKPVNDLSRGALVEDIVYTIALTAVQATQA